MKLSIKLKPSLWDAVVVGVIVVAAALIGAMLWGQTASAAGEDLTAVITQNGEVLYTIDLASLEEDHREITIKGAYTSVVALEPDRVCIQSSDCPTQDCVHTGWISRPGQSIVCLPNHLVVELIGSGTQSDGVDAVIG